MSNTTTIFQNELKDLLRNRVTAVVLAVFVVTTSLSVLIGSLDFAVKADAFRAYVDALVANGGDPSAVPPQLFPLQLFRGGIEYLEILGALFAVVVGYTSIAKERHRGTLPLVLTRPVSGLAIYSGKLLAQALLWLVTIAVTFLVGYLISVTLGHASVSLVDLERVGIATIASWLYLMFWSSFAMMLTAILRKGSSALVLAVAAWLLVVLVIPQVGDTMDPDNQLPGGLFQTLQIAKTDENAVLEHFAGYNNTRDALEVSSVTKHYERVSFAFLGIKDKYNLESIPFVWNELFVNSSMLLIFTSGSIAAGLFTNRRKALLGKIK